MNEKTAKQSPEFSNTEHRSQQNVGTSDIRTPEFSNAGFDHKGVGNADPLGDAVGNSDTINHSMAPLSEPRKSHSAQPCLLEVTVVSSWEEAEALSAHLRHNLKAQEGILPSIAPSVSEPTQNRNHAHSNPPMPLAGQAPRSSELEGGNTKDRSFSILNCGGNGAEPVTEGHADKLNGSWGVLVAISQAAQGAGNIFQRIRDGLGGVFIAFGKFIEGRDERIAGGHRVGDVITYRPVGQASSLQARIVRIVGEAAMLSNGAVVSADRIRERGLV